MHAFNNPFGVVIHQPFNISLWHKTCLYKIDRKNVRFNWKCVKQVLLIYYMFCIAFILKLIKNVCLFQAIFIFYIVLVLEYNITVCEQKGMCILQPEALLEKCKKVARYLQINYSCICMYIKIMQKKYDWLIDCCLTSNGKYFNHVQDGNKIANNKSLCRL